MDNAKAIEARTQTVSSASRGGVVGSEALRSNFQRVREASNKTQDSRFIYIGGATIIMLFISAVYFVLTGPFATLTNANPTLSASEENTLIFAHPLTIKADGVETSKVDVFVASSDGKPLSNKVVDVLTSAGDVNPQRVVTDDTGHATFSLTMTDQSIATISFSVDSKPFSRQVTVKGE